MNHLLTYCLHKVLNVRKFSIQCVPILRGLSTQRGFKTDSGKLTCLLNK